MFPYEPNEILGRGKEFSHSGRAENGARAKRTRDGGGVGEGKLARKPLYSEKRPPTFTVDFTQ